MNHYTASIEYNLETIHTLSLIVSNTFHFGVKLAYLGVCLFFLILGAVLGWQTPAGITCIALGCFLFPSVKAFGKSRASQTIRQLGASSLKVRYEFSGDTFSCTDGKDVNRFSYLSIIRLTEDRAYYYLFPNPKQAYMIDKASLKPNKPEEFKEFIASRVELEWTQPVSFFTLNLKQLKFNRRNTRKS